MEILVLSFVWFGWMIAACWLRNLVDKIKNKYLDLLGICVVFSITFILFLYSIFTVIKLHREEFGNPKEVIKIEEKIPN